MKKRLFTLLIASLVVSSCGLFGPEETKPPTGTERETSPVTEKTQPSSVQIISESVNEGNAEGCKNLTDLSEQQSCQSQVYAVMAIQKKDAAICEKIASTEEQTACKETIVAKEYELAGEVEKCDTLINENLKKDCYNNGYFNKAVAEKNAQLCQKITFDPQKETCLNAVGE